MLSLPDGLRVVAEGAPGTQQCLSLSGTGWEVGAYEVVLEGDFVVVCLAHPMRLVTTLVLVVDIVANPNVLVALTSMRQIFNPLPRWRWQL